MTLGISGRCKRVTPPPWRSIATLSSVPFTNGGSLHRIHAHTLPVNKSFGSAPTPFELVTIAVGLRDTLTLATGHRLSTAGTRTKSRHHPQSTSPDTYPRSLMLPSPPLTPTQRKAIHCCSTTLCSSTCTSPGPNTQGSRRIKGAEVHWEGVTDAEPYTQHMRPRSKVNGPVISQAGDGKPGGAERGNKCRLLQPPRETERG